MPLVARRYRGVYLGLFGAFALFGASMTIFGAALPKLLSDFGWSYATAGAVIAAVAAAYFPASLGGGWILRRLGPKATAVLGLSACAAGTAFFAASPAFLPNLLLNLVIGAGQGLIEVAINWSVLRMDEKGSGKGMSLVHGAFSAGAVVGPLGMGAFIGLGLGWILLYRVIAAVFALIALALALLPFDRLPREPAADAPRERGRPLARRPVYWLGFAALFAYVGAELGLSNWMAEYFVRVFGSEPARASFMVSLFWIGLLAGRFGAPALYRGSQELLLGLCSLVLAVSVTGLAALGFAAGAAVAPEAAASWIGPALVLLAGLGSSIVYPVVLSLVGASFPRDQSRAVSFAVAGGGLGLFSFPFLMSWISEGWGIRWGFASYALIALATFALCAALIAAFRSERGRRGA